MRQAFVIFMFTLFGGNALADGVPEGDTGDLEALLGESVVTTASRTAERASVAPATVFNITSAEMHRAGIRTVDEALEYLGLGIYVNKVRDYVSGSDVGAQGILLRDGGRHVLVMLDGNILNSQGTGRVSVNEGLGVPLDAIDHIEVMLGPGSVMYGSNAMLAVVNVVSKRARDLNGVQAVQELGTSTPMDAAGHITSGKGTEWGVRYRLSLGFGKRFTIGHTEGEVTATAEMTQELTNTYGIQPFTPGPTGNHSFLPGQATWGGNASNQLRAPNGLVSVTLGKFRLVVNAFDYLRTTPLTGTFMDPASKEHQSGVRVDLRHVIDLTSKLNLTSRLYGGYAAFSEPSNYGEAFWCIAGETQGCRFDQRAKSGWVGLEQQLAVDWFGNGKVATQFGYDARLRFFDMHSGDYHDLVTGAAPSISLPHTANTSFIGALFIQQVWRPLTWLSLNVGGRLDGDSTFGVRVSPRAAVVFTPADKTVLRLSYNEAFRAPSEYELHEFDPTFRISPTKLRPETVRSVELELQQRVWRLTMSVRGFASFYTDFIDSRPATTAEVMANANRLSSTVDPSNVVVNDNISSLHVFGGSASMQLRLPKGFSAAYTFNIARTLHPSGAVDQRLPLFYGNFRAGWQSSDDGYSVMVLGVYTSGREVLYNATPTTLPSIGSRVDLRLAAAGPIPQLKGLSWRVAIGAALNPEQPYALAYGPTLPKGAVLYPVQTRLFGFVGLNYAWTGL